MRMINLPEPKLRFGYDQSLTHPKDGLSVFGPYQPATGQIRIGLIGTRTGIEIFKKWSKTINTSLPAYKGSKFRTSQTAEFGKLAHQSFPGFHAAFGTTWELPAAIEAEIADNALESALKVHERHTRIARTVKLYTKKLVKLNYASEKKPDIWFVIVSKELSDLCRPASDPPEEYSIGTRAEDAFSPSLFVDSDDADSFSDEYQEALRFKPDFHNQIKARLLKHQIITQVLNEETMAACMRPPEDPARDKQDPATLTWNLATQIFYKTRRKPWILSDPREGVSYMGVVFKRLNTLEGQKNACCGAQMFLEDGSGMVFKGALGPWYSEETRECHLDEVEAYDLLERAIKSYAEDHGEHPPKEVFIHGSVFVDDKEWAGYSSCAKKYGINVVGVRIRRVLGGLRLYGPGKSPILRGTALIVSDRKAFLWTAGFVPRLNTYPGWNVPNPLMIDICNGDADIEVVLNDILRLSKLNYNSCSFADSSPITLKFASKVGDILTTLPPHMRDEEDANDDGQESKALPFWHYI